MSLPTCNGKKVLITGINGYIASRIGHDLLKRGYMIRGTSRSKPSTEALLNGAYKEFADRVEMVSVPDMTVPGAFDEAVKGAEAEKHCPSRLSVNANTNIRRHCDRPHCLPSQLPAQDLGRLRYTCRQWQCLHPHLGTQACGTSTRGLCHDLFAGRDHESSQQEEIYFHGEGLEQLGRVYSSRPR